ncbi:aspartate-alanine antiporter [Cellulophaga algicola DSM 14237]|uniref:Aspartate-alanine antiporter n=1 Tax=Cellulophaga algicola (strain DSM 14237 / IC166 / ACAM 630) TaxID=688270 RepID=E6X490_CELAD|nr:aspartate-alanine antiporter [Cellulophaga algicola]ADV51473.1 aspartate-alanine antiporter [Cellulophaga algicola DSM 14237]
MEIIYNQLRNFPYFTLFLAIAIGFFVGKFKIGKFSLGGVGGTLIAAVILGQVGGIEISDEVKSLFFALFIFMVGYLGGPQFFASLKISSLKYLLAAFLMTAMGLFAVLGLAIWFGLDKGMAAGLAAGGLTQSAIIGTAGEAIDKLGLAVDVSKNLKMNVAVGYSITYIFGSIGPILMVSIIPIVMKWDIRAEAKKLAIKLGGSKELEEGEFDPIKRIDTRVYKIIKTSKFLNKSVLEFETEFNSNLTVELIINNKKNTEPSASTIINEDDILFVTGLITAFSKVGFNIGEEISEFGPNIDLTEEVRHVIATNKKLTGLTLEQVLKKLDIDKRHGVYIKSITRMSHQLPVLDKTEIHKGDEIELVGKKKDLDRIEKEIGYKPPSIKTTDFVVLGLGMVVGYLIGQIGFEINGTSLALGAGLGCLVSGLLIGFLKTKYPKLGGINVGAANFIQTIGLAVFVGIVGLNAGAPAFQAILKSGVTLFLLGILVTMLPMIVQFVINYYVLKIKNPVEALGVLTGSRSSNPGFSALLDKTKNATPVPTFTMTYAVANIFLTLWGPVIIALIP